MKNLYTKNCSQLVIIAILALMSTSCKQKASLYTIETSMGNIQVALYDNTPLHKANFEKFVQDGTYNGTIFHRVIKDFMIQGGDPLRKDPSFVEKTIPAEFVPGNYHKKGALAAARMGDQVNPEKRSSVQFYIVQGKVYSENELKDLEEYAGKSWTPEQRATYKTVGGTPFLDQEYTVFGEVVKGLDLVDKIAATPTGPGDQPRNDVEIIRIVKN